MKKILLSSSDKCRDWSQRGKVTWSCQRDQEFPGLWSGSVVPEFIRTLTSSNTPLVACYLLLILSWCGQNFKQKKENLTGRWARWKEISPLELKEHIPKKGKKGDLWPFVSGYGMKMEVKWEKKNRSHFIEWLRKGRNRKKPHCYMVSICLAF
jgi:hypothetical protein